MGRVRGEGSSSGEKGQSCCTWVRGKATETLSRGELGNALFKEGKGNRARDGASLFISNLCSWDRVCSCNDYPR